MRRTRCVAALSRLPFRRSLVGLLVVSMLVPAVPAQAQTPASTLPPQANREQVQTARSLVRAPIATRPVRVNRTVPRATPPPAAPVFSTSPTSEEIGRARVFDGPLVPLGIPAASENAALAAVIASYARGARLDDVQPFTRFLDQHPNSPWRASVLANLGGIHSQVGFVGRAVAAWREAWTLANDREAARERAVGASALGDWLALTATIGDRAGLREAIAAAEGAALGGPAAGKLRHARQTLSIIERYPERVISSGVRALDALLDERHVAATDHSRAALAAYRPTADGLSMATLLGLARSAGLALQPVVGQEQPTPVVPSIVHWRFGHYAALVAERDGLYLLKDPVLGGERWVPRAVLDSEMSGFALIPSGDRPPGWRTADDGELTTVIGYSCPDGGPSPEDPPPPPCGGGPGGTGGGNSGDGGGGCGSGCPKGMPAYRFHPVQASLLLDDVPLSYTPARGPEVALTIHYNHRYSVEPQIPVFSHLGPQWSFDWASYGQEVLAGCGTGCWPAHVRINLPGGGREYYYSPDAQGVYPANPRSGAVLVRVSDDPIRYERRLPDQRVDVYGQPDGGLPGQRRVFLTERRDARGQALTFTWDAQARLVAVTDALGQVTTLAYDDGADPLRLTGVTDPFGRTATFTYTGAGQLASVTDTLGLTSTFGYQAEDFIGTLTTPYGTTSFRHERDRAGFVNDPMIEATDPLGGVAHLEYHFATPELAAAVPAGCSEVPTGFAAHNAALDLWNTYYWDAAAWAAGPGNVGLATVTHWMLYGWAAGQTRNAVSAPHSVQRPLEARVWYGYHGQTDPQALGSSSQVARVGRVLDDGSSPITLTTSNAQDQVTSRTDPLGRTTTYTYAANGVDLLEVRQQRSGGTDLLAQYAAYTGLHQPQTVTDASGETTTLTYNAAGQVLTTTNALNQTTTYVYDGDGRLTSVTGPVGGATTTYTYDAYGRVRTVTSPDGYTVTTDADVFDRPVQTTYPDGTWEETTYDRLHVASRRDRAGRVTRYGVDAARRLVWTRDPAGRTVQQRWGESGLGQLIDAKGQATTWERDVQGRVTREVRADGLTATVYTYEARSGRVATVTDPTQQVTTYAYGLDDAVSAVTFSNAQIPTPGVSYTYDPDYPRVTTMVDGTGTTAYTYHPAGQAGAGQVATVDGPLTDDTIAYGYDELNRMVSRAINGVAMTLAYDGLGRVAEEVNVLGTFTYGYDGVSARLASVTYPNGQTSAYSYLPVAQDLRLETIHHRKPDTSTLSRFDYTYDAVGNILTWQQQADSAQATIWRYGYDAADQLTAAVHQTTDATPSLLARYAYAYDPAGNRTVEQIDDAVTVTTHDRLNRLVTQAPGGVLRFAGTVNEPATVTIQGQPAAVTAGGQFAAGVPVTSGTNTVTITATDPSGNTATAVFEVDQTGSTKSFTYDANGNLTSDGTRTFEWDARNQLVAINVGTHRSEFTYDGQQRRVRIVEKENSVVQSDRKVLWCGKEECEERAADGATVTRRIWWQGEHAAGAARFFAADHLGSVTDVTDGAGTEVARYAFDVWGRRTLVTGVDVTGVGYTGHRWQETGRAWLALYRGYDPDLGRWLSEDPVGFGDGPNLLAYVGNDPVGASDPFGLTAYRCRRPLGGRGGISRRQERTGTYHEYYCVSNGGVTRCCGQTTDSRTGYGPGRPTRPDEGDVVDPEQCTTFPASDCVERCLLRNCDAPRPYYGVVGPGTNCQEWTADSRNACRDRCEAEDRRGGR